MTEQPVIGPDAVVVLRRALVQYRDRPHIYRDLLLVYTIVDQFRSRVDPTRLGAGDRSGPRWYLTATEAAELLHITPDAVQKACRTGRLPATKRPGSREWTITADAVAAYRAA